MKIFIFTIFLIFAVFTKDPVRLTILVDPQEEEFSDYVQVVLEISKKSQSLVTALSDAAHTINEIINKHKSFCEKQGIKLKKCTQSIEVQNYEVEAEYKQSKKQKTFVGFIVKHEIIIKVSMPEKIGSLIDDLYTVGITKFKSFEWKNNQEGKQQASIIQNAINKANNFCEQINYRFERIISISQNEVQQEQESDEQEDGQQQKQQEQEQKVGNYAVVIQCVQKQKKSQRKGNKKDNNQL